MRQPDGRVDLEAAHALEVQLHRPRLGRGVERVRVARVVHVAGHRVRELDGAAPDVGAYERSTGDNPGWAIQEGFKVPGVDGEPISEEVGGCGCNDDSLVQNAWMIVGLLPLLGLRRRS